ncbi:hypothetical protein [Pseudomonas brassicacearum]|uniref:hypothetical protein n=1 Tax=Pseudomonas TaxID=286 RepID=UPI0005B3882E|nr:hypothetical protein [Pseudomonas brassicacearum]
MKSSQVVEAFSSQIESAKQRGSTEVTIESLEIYLESLREHIEKQAPLDEANAEFQRQAHEYAVQAEHEMFKTVIDSGQAALKASLLIGGGSVVALLAFASSAWKALSSDGLSLLGLTVFLLAVGVLLVGIASCLTYAAQSSYHSGLDKPDDCKQDKAGDRLRLAACTMVAGTYLLYGWCCWNIFLVMTSFKVESFIPVG